MTTSLKVKKTNRSEPVRLPSEGFNRGVLILCVMLTLLGIGFRFYGISADEFFYYDEGLYLNMNRKLLKFIHQNWEQALRDFPQVLETLGKSALGSPKALFLLISDARVFWGGYAHWHFPRLVSAVSGLLTIFLTYLFAKRYYANLWIGGLSMVVLALMPSHVFYSRLAMQESLATLFFLLGFYLYIFSERSGLKVFLSALSFAAAYFCNYRLLILPLFVLLFEGYGFLLEKRSLAMRKFIWFLLIFLAIVLGIGALYGGRNLSITWAWILRQSYLAGEEEKSLLTFLSYPYYIFRLESVFLGMAVFAHIYFLWRRRWKGAFPYFIVLAFMLIYSFSMEQGVRYLCVVLPFLAMAGASGVVVMGQESPDRYRQKLVRIMTGLMVISLGFNAYRITRFQTAYKSSMEFLNHLDPQAKVLSSQPFIQNLYVEDPDRVKEVPKLFPQFVQEYLNGFQYLILCPQSYVSKTQSEKRFDPPLINYLEFIVNRVPPLKVYDHLQPWELERFVMDHNTHLERSLHFLRPADARRGQLRIYSIAQCIQAVQRQLENKFQPERKEWH